MNLEELLHTLEVPIVVRPTRRMTRANWNPVRQSRRHPARNVDHSEFCGYVFALLLDKKVQYKTA
jgi:type I restriction enzyme M protein